MSSDGSVHTTGRFEGAVDFDPGTGARNLTSVGGNDVFVLKLDAMGNHIWSQRIGGTGNDVGNGISIGRDGSVHTTGSFTGTVDFDPSTTGLANLTARDFDAFISKLDASGNFVWARQIGGIAIDDGRGIVVGDDGSVYATGNFSGTAEFGPGAGSASLTSVGSADVFVTSWTQPVTSRGPSRWEIKDSTLAEHSYRP